MVAGLCDSRALPGLAPLPRSSGVRPGNISPPPLFLSDIKGDGEFLNLMRICWPGPNKQQEMKRPRLIWRFVLSGYLLSPRSPNTQHRRYAGSFIYRRSQIYVFSSDPSAATPA